MIKLKILSAVFFIALVASVLASCAKEDSAKKKPVEKECSLPEEQANSLQGKWEKPPIKVSVHSGDFSTDELEQMARAGQTWNAFFTESKGGNIFDFSSENQSSVNQTVPNCGSSTLSDGTIIYKRPTNWTKSATAVAITTFCFRKSTQGGLNTIYNAIMDINYQNFFSDSSGQFPDLESIVLHELGHLMGLDHSCGPLRNNLPNVTCPDEDSDASNPLLSTVMFPKVFFNSEGTGEIKRSLHSNDQGRANCLY